MRFDCPPSPVAAGGVLVAAGGCSHRAPCVSSSCCCWWCCSLLMACPASCTSQVMPEEHLVSSQEASSTTQGGQLSLTWVSFSKTQVTNNSPHLPAWPHPACGLQLQPGHSYCPPCHQGWMMGLMDAGCVPASRASLSQQKLIACKLGKALSGSLPGTSRPWVQQWA